MEKYREIINDSDRWLDFRNIRNRLTHEYPNNQDDMIKGLKLSIKYFEEISGILKNIENYIDKKGL